MHVYLQQVELGHCLLPAKHLAVIATPPAKTFGIESPLTFPAPPVSVTDGKIVTKIKQTFVMNNCVVQHCDLFWLPFVKIKNYHKIEQTFMIDNHFV